MWLSTYVSRVGIPHDHLDRIFERFYRVDKAAVASVGHRPGARNREAHCSGTWRASVSHQYSGQGSTFTLRIPHDAKS